MSGEPSGTAHSPAESLTVRSYGGGLYVGVRVTPSAARTAVRGQYGDRLKVSLTAPPEDNRANRQLEEALSVWLGLRRAEVRVDSGHGSRDKVVAFLGISETELRDRLGAILAGRPRQGGNG